MHLRDRLSPAFEDSSFAATQNWRRIVTRRLQQLAKAKSLSNIERELPDFLLMLSLTLKSGLSIPNSLIFLSEKMTGMLAENLRNMISDVELGADLANQLELLAIRLPAPSLEEMCEKLVLALRSGTSVSDSLYEQSETVSDALARTLAKQAAANETKMLVPTIFLILPITVLFAIFPSLSMLGSQI